MATEDSLGLQVRDEQEAIIVHDMLETLERGQPTWEILNAALKGSTRPSVPRGYRRIEWTCVGSNS